MDQYLECFSTLFASLSAALEGQNALGMLLHQQRQSTAREEGRALAAEQRLIRARLHRARRAQAAQNELRAERASSRSLRTALGEKTQEVQTLEGRISGLCTALAASESAAEGEAAGRRVDALRTSNEIRDLNQALVTTRAEAEAAATGRLAEIEGRRTDAAAALQGFQELQSALEREREKVAAAADRERELEALVEREKAARREGASDGARRVRESKAREKELAAQMARMAQEAEAAAKSLRDLAAAKTAGASREERLEAELKAAKEAAAAVEAKSKARLRSVRKEAKACSSKLTAKLEEATKAAEAAAAAAAEADARQVRAIAEIEKAREDERAAATEKTTRLLREGYEGAYTEARRAVKAEEELLAEQAKVESLTYEISRLEAALAARADAPLGAGTPPAGAPAVETPAAVPLSAVAEPKGLEPSVVILPGAQTLSKSQRRKAKARRALPDASARETPPRGAQQAAGPQLLSRATPEPPRHRAGAVVGGAMGLVAREDPGYPMLKVRIVMQALTVNM